MRTLLIAALAATGLATCACTGQGTSAAPQATVTVQATHTVTAQPSPPPAAPSSPAAAPASAPAPSAAAPAGCLTRYLGAKVGVSQGTAATSFVVIVFRNLQTYPCTLYGYPGVALAGGKPATQIGLAAAEDPATPRELVTLPPGGRASALLKIVRTSTLPPSKCGAVTAHWLQIIPPNQTVPIYLGFTEPTCAKPLQTLYIDAVRPGAGSGA
jgi:Domain of unknown function (DUF4232)